MPLQMYECPEHGVWETTIRVCEDLPFELHCPVVISDDFQLCAKVSTWKAREEAAGVGAKVPPR